MSNLGQIQKDLSMAALSQQSDSSPFLIFTIDNIILAINCKYVVAIEKLEVITEVAKTSRNSDVKGITHYKNEAVNIINLRAVFGYSSQIDQLNNEINIPGRIQDHLDFVADLENCIEEGRRFTRTTDPHLCKFGKWYYDYKPKSIAVQSIIEKIEEPHETVHKYAAYINDYIETGETAQAKSYAKEVKEKYCADVIHYMEALDGLLHETLQDLIIIANINNKKVGFLIDTAESVDSMDEIQRLPSTTAVSSHITRLGLLKNESKGTPDIVLILEPESFS